MCIVQCTQYKLCAGCSLHFYTQSGTLIPMSRSISYYILSLATQCTHYTDILQYPEYTNKYCIYTNSNIALNIKHTVCTACYAICIICSMH